MKKRVLILAACLFPLLYTDAGMACSCVPYEGTPREKVNQASERSVLIFLGTVTSVERIAPKDYSPYWQDWAAETEAKDIELDKTTFLVKEVFKGPDVPIIQTTIETICCLCGFIFEEGKHYLVYAHKQHTDGTYEASTCSRTGLLEHAQEDIMVLRARKDQ